ncbi:hypothetical protein PFLmoz3_03088 [Pseudomonas fluorescens]|uniref:Uncharacterized protein n=1 Tax=Pseudomonas fluorescens TaxID=294 RepID=A0A109LH42_PSEFL|nr:hypothetical protein PFLmoz3_03088 [Pseudomonas fluorescens]
MQHLQDHGSEVGAQDLRVGKFRAPDKVFFAVQAHANTRLNPAATAFTLVGAGLGNRLDGQTLHFGAVAVATDARRTAVDHVANARHGQRGFRDVGRQHHAPARVGLENALLLGRRQPCVQRQNLGVLELGLAQHVGRVTNLALAGQEHQYIARTAPFAALIGGDFIKGGKDRLVDGQVVLDAVALLVLFQGEWAIPGVHREGTARHLDNRRIVEVLGKALQVDGGRGDDDFQVGATRQQGLEVAEQEVDVQAAFVGFVDDDRVVALEVAVVLGFGQQDAVGHQLDQGVGVTLVFEAHLVTDQRT